jgi:hypothetical protein
LLSAVLLLFSGLSFADDTSSEVSLDTDEPGYILAQEDGEDEGSDESDEESDDEGSDESDEESTDY